MKKVAYACALVALALTLFYACKKNLEESTDSQRAVSQSTVISIKKDFCINTAEDPEWTKMKAYDLRYAQFGINVTYKAYLLEFSEKAMENFGSRMLNSESKIIGIALYLSSTEKITTVNSSIVNGLSLYTLTKGIVEHRLFLKSQAGYAELDEYHFEANNVSSSDLSFVLFNVVPKELRSQAFVYIKNFTPLRTAKLASHKDGFALRKAVFNMEWCKANKALVSQKKVFRKAPPSGGHQVI